jgi:hypothetical protein
MQKVEGSNPFSRFAGSGSTEPQTVSRRTTKFSRRRCLCFTHAHCGHRAGRARRPFHHDALKPALAHRLEQRRALVRRERALRAPARPVDLELGEQRTPLAVGQFARRAPPRWSRSEGGTMRATASPRDSPPWPPNAASRAAGRSPGRLRRSGRRARRRAAADLSEGRPGAPAPGRPRCSHGPGVSAGIAHPGRDGPGRACRRTPMASPSSGTAGRPRLSSSHLTAAWSAGEPGHPRARCLGRTSNRF